MFKQYLGTCFLLTYFIYERALNLCRLPVDVLSYKCVEQTTINIWSVQPYSPHRLAQERQWLKGIVSWDWYWLEWIGNERSKELRIAGAYFYWVWFHFHVLICKKQALSVAHLTVTLRMMSNNRRSVSSIGFVHVRSIL